MVADLERRSDVHLLRIEEPSLPAAILAGRRHVETPFFSFLDDDDEYLPGTLATRVQYLLQNPAVSILVTNGLRHAEGRDQPALSHLDGVVSDPLLALFVENWMTSCGVTFRASDCPDEAFAAIPKYLEWTWLAFNAANSGRTIAVLDTPTFRIYDTADSESKSDAYRRSQLETFQRMLAVGTRPDIRRRLRSRIGAYWHDQSSAALVQGSLGEAVACHLRSLWYPDGLKYLTYTRRLIRRPTDA